MRIKHRVGENSVKMYDKQGSVLRVETTINDVDDFKTFRAPENKPDAAPSWQRMRKGVADLHRRAQVSQAANDRYLQALASVEDTTSLGELAARLCRPVRYQRRRVRAINPHASDDAALLEAISRGEFTLNGLRNRDIRALLYPRPARSRAEQKRQAGWSHASCTCSGTPVDTQGVAHAPISPHKAGRIVVTAIIAARNANTQELAKMAA